MARVPATFFAAAADFRAWLAEHHAAADELWVGYWKKATGKPSVTWEETVDEALCFGWIDGIRKSRDADSYVVRFTPRNPKSAWSQRNLDRVAALQAAGRMAPAGLAAFAHKDVHPDSGYRVSELPTELPRAMLDRLRLQPDAWEFFQAQPAGYRRQVTRWILAAKREDTRARRLATLIEDSADGLRIRQLRKD